MRPAVWPRSHPESERLLVVDVARESILESHVNALASLLEPGDLVVVNDAAVLPGSLHTTLSDALESAEGGTGIAIELRLFDLDVDAGRAHALAFGEGSWRAPTESRAPVPELRPGLRLAFGATIESVEASRLIRIRFDRRGAPLLQAIYRHGRPIQYSYLAGPLDLWHVQSPFASRPWAAEMPSAGRPLRWEVLFALRRRGVRIASLTHAAGLSSSGSEPIDRTFPRPERYEIPLRTTQLIAATRAEGGRVVAIGTTVVRALESSMAEHRVLVPGRGIARLRLDARHERQAVDGIFTGLHEAGTSHFELLEAFAPRVMLERAIDRAEAAGYLAHEFGDSLLVLPSPRPLELAA